MTWSGDTRSSMSCAQTRPWRSMRASRREASSTVCTPSSSPRRNVTRCWRRAGREPQAAPGGSAPPARPCGPGRPTPPPESLPSARPTSGALRPCPLFCFHQSHEHPRLSSQRDWRLLEGLLSTWPTLTPTHTGLQNACPCGLAQPTSWPGGRPGQGHVELASSPEFPLLSKGRQMQPILQMSKMSFQLLSVWRPNCLHHHPLPRPACLSSHKAPCGKGDPRLTLTGYWETSAITTVE